MKIPRLGDRPEDRVIEEAAAVALVTGEKLVALDSLKAMKGLNALEIGTLLQGSGYGRLIEISSGHEREFHFSVRGPGFDHANEVKKLLRARTLRGCLARIDWIAVNSVATLVAAIAAVLAAYFSYLSLTSK